MLKGVLKSTRCDYRKNKISKMGSKMAEVILWTSYDSSLLRSLPAKSPMCMWLAIVELAVWFHSPENKGSCHAVNKGLHRRRNVRSCASASLTMSGKHPPLPWMLTFQDLVIFKDSTMLADTGWKLKKTEKHGKYKWRRGNKDRRCLPS